MRLLIHVFVMGFISLAILVAAGLGARAIVSGKSQYVPGPVPEKHLPVETHIWRERPARPIVSGYGIVEARRRLDLRVEVDGRLTEVATAMRTGARVEKGEVLLRIDPFDYEAAADEARLLLEELKLSLSEIQAQIASETELLPQDLEQETISKEEFQRQSSLKIQGVVSAAAFDSARTQLNNARQAVAARKQQILILNERVKQKRVAIRRQEIIVQRAESQLAKTVLIAEFDGFLANISAEEGRLVSRNEAVGELMDPAELEVRFNLSQEEFAILTRGIQQDVAEDRTAHDLEAGVQIIWSFGGQNISTPARIERISPIIDDSQGGLELFAVIDSAGTEQTAFQPLPRPGTFAEVQIIGPEIANAVTVPITALSAQNEIYVVGEDDILEEVQVQVFERRGAEALVSGNLPDGTRIVAARFPRLARGVKVQDSNAEANQRDQTHQKPQDHRRSLEGKKAS